MEIRAALASWLFNLKYHERGFVTKELEEALERNKGNS
jgi:hypothetical protein